MLLSVAALAVIISLGSWLWNTLFIVNCKTVYPLKLFKKKKNKKTLVLLEFFFLGKSLPAPLRDATTPSVDWLCRDLAWCHGTGAHSPDVKVISRPCFVSCIPFTSSWIKPHELTGSWWLYINCTDFSGNKNKSCSLLTEQGRYSLGEREEELKWL